MIESQRYPVTPREVFYYLRHMKKVDLFGPTPANDEDLKTFAQNRSADSERRRSWVEALGARSQGEPLRPLTPASQRNVERLLDPNTQVVVAGQQPALFGGPLMIHTKILSLLAWVDRLESLGIPAVPIFWVADEDHDVGELAPGGFRTGSEDPRVFDVPFERGRQPVRSLELRDLDAWQEKVLAQTEGLPYQSQIKDLIDSSASSFVSRSFHQLLQELYGDHGLIVLSPFDLRALQAGPLEREARQPGRLAGEVARANPTLEGYGSKPPIERVADLPFFYFDGEGQRHRLDWDRERELGSVKAKGGSAEEGAVLGSSFSAEELAAAIIANPHRFSPDALLRPLVQDELFEPLVSIVGPTEMGYQLQLMQAYADRSIRRPLLSHRLRIRLLGDTDRLTAVDAGLRLDQLRAEDDPRQWVPSKEAEGWVQELSWRSDPFLELLSILSDEERFGRPLSKRTDRLKRRLRDDLTKLRDAVRREVGGDVQEAREAATRIHRGWWINGKPAEREVSVLSYIAQFGRDWLLDLRNHFDPYHVGESVMATPATEPTQESSDV